MAFSYNAWVYKRQNARVRHQLQKRPVFTGDSDVTDGLGTDSDKAGPPALLCQLPPGE